MIFDTEITNSFSEHHTDQAPKAILFSDKGKIRSDVTDASLGGEQKMLSQVQVDGANNTIHLCIKVYTIEKFNTQLKVGLVVSNLVSN